MQCSTISSLTFVPLFDVYSFDCAGVLRSTRYGRRRMLDDKHPITRYGAGVLVQKAWFGGVSYAACVCLLDYWVVGVGMVEVLCRSVVY